MMIMHKTVVSLYEASFLKYRHHSSKLNLSHTNFWTALKGGFLWQK